MTRNGELPAASPQFTITRKFNAPRELVFKAWTDATYVAQWWGPRGFTSPFCKIDFRVGGSFHYCMRSPEGKDYWNKGEFKTIVAPEKIVSTMYFSDAAGNAVEPRNYGMDGFPSVMLDVVTFEVLPGGKTQLTLQRNHSESLAERFGEDKGWRECLDKFATAIKQPKDAAVTVKVPVARIKRPAA